LASVTRVEADRLPPRLLAWQKRLLEEQLDVWGELWIEDVNALADYPDWVALAEARGREDSDLRYSMTRGLLAEVVFAAGGIESALDRIEEALEDAQVWADQHVELRDRDPSVPLGVVTPQITHAVYAFHELIDWARALADRIDRMHKPGSRARVGLLPALGPDSLRSSVSAALEEYRGKLNGMRAFTNYGLHAGSVHGTSTPSAQVGTDGQLRVPFADPVDQRITSWESFRYEQGRDLLTEARAVMQAAVYLVDTILDAFRAHRPARVSGKPGGC
jgi:hypothetical protein